MGFSLRAVLNLTPTDPLATNHLSLSLLAKIAIEFLLPDGTIAGWKVLWRWRDRVRQDSGQLWRCRSSSNDPVGTCRVQVPTLWAQLQPWR